MNLFNSFQAVGFYSLLPFGIIWLFNNEQSVWGYAASAVMFIGYVMLSFAAHIASES